MAIDVHSSTLENVGERACLTMTVHEEGCSRDLPMMAEPCRRSAVVGRCYRYETVDSRIWLAADQKWNDISTETADKQRDGHSAETAQCETVWRPAGGSFFRLSSAIFPDTSSTNLDDKLLELRHELLCMVCNKVCGLLYILRSGLHRCNTRGFLIIITKPIRTVPSSSVRSSCLHWLAYQATGLNVGKSHGRYDTCNLALQKVVYVALVCGFSSYLLFMRWLVWPRGIVFDELHYSQRSPSFTLIPHVNLWLQTPTRFHSISYSVGFCLFAAVIRRGLDRPSFVAWTLHYSLLL